MRRLDLGHGPGVQRLTRTLRQIDQVRQGPAIIEVQAANGQPCHAIHVSAEQESHEFLFGVVMPDLDSFCPAERSRCLERAQEVFNHLVLPGEDWPGGPNLTLVDVSRPEAGPTGKPLGQLRVELDRLGGADKPLVVVASGRTVGMSGPSTAALPDRQVASRVVNLYMLCFSHPAVRGVVWTGFTDREPAVLGNGLLREDLAPKGALQMLRKLVGTVWHTRAAGQTDAAGQFHFRGFFGDYRVVVVPAGATAEVQRRTLSSKDASPWPSLTLTR